MAVRFAAATKPRLQPKHPSPRATAAILAAASSCIAGIACEWVSSMIAIVAVAEALLYDLRMDAGLEPPPAVSNRRFRP